jgi:hypothetical protein
MIKDSIKGNWKRLAALVQARCAISREGVRRPLELPETVLQRPRRGHKDSFQTYGGTP